MGRFEIKAIAWDYDGTLVDTREKNLNVTGQVILALTGREPSEFPVLRSIRSYGESQRRYLNWREFYIREFGLTEEETDEAGHLWSEYQLRDQTTVPVFAGIERVLGASRDIPHGIVSQNSRDQIRQTLVTAGIDSHFKSVVGYEEVGLRRQKPDPDGLIRCLEELRVPSTGHLVYIGDHEVDVKTARNAASALRQAGADLHVHTIAVAYGGDSDPQSWTFKPDFVAHEPDEILRHVRALENTRARPARLPERG